MTGSQEFSSSRYWLGDDGDFLQLRWAPGVTIDADDVRSTIAAVTAASPNGKRPLLVNIGKVERITSDAKQLLIEDTCSTRTAVIGIDEVSRVITAFNYRSATPSRYFTEEPDAITWLLQDDSPKSIAFSVHPFTAEMRGEVLWIHCKASTEVDTATATAILDRARQLSPTTCPPMLIRLNHLISISEEALHTLATGLNIAALAIVGADPGDPIITAYYKQQHHPPYPTQHFTTINDAQHWITSSFQRRPPTRQETSTQPPS